MNKGPNSKAKRPSRGFRSAAGLLQTRIRQAGESRGFAVTRLLTHWAEIVGPEFAGVARPVDVRYGRKGFGATLTVLTTGAQAQMLEMSKARILERVNACYGYNAISRIFITQTAPTGFADGAVQFGHAPAPDAPRRDPELRARAAETASAVSDPGLKAALEALGENILTARNTTKGS
ncbi:DUF721 domain-containing protein [Profundibacterium mesophilum]|nr:DUF721 domain-containing protein [Profundibacterium mesophilum]